MKTSDIGDILKKRIKELGYTQEKFCDKVGISRAALQDYMSGKTIYNYELLLRFAESLDCSFDYLLGKSNATHPEYEDIKSLTRLSDEAIRIISFYGHKYDDSVIFKRYIDTLNAIIINNGVIQSIAEYLIPTRVMQNIMKIICEQSRISLGKQGFDDESMIDNAIPSADISIIISIFDCLKNMKGSILPEFVEEMRIYCSRHDDKTILKESYLVPSVIPGKH